MTITFLGTAATNAFPEAFCKCRNCAKARTLGGPSLRKRSAALINNDLLIDLAPTLWRRRTCTVALWIRCGIACKPIRTLTIWTCPIYSLAAQPMVWLAHL